VYNVLVMAAGKSPKEKVLHTRVPEALDTQIKALADALRVPVSSLVRNILEDSVALMDTASTGLDQTLENVKKNVRTLSEHARADQQEIQDGLRRGWAEFQSVLAHSFRAKANGSGASAPASAASEAATSPPANELFPEVLGWQSLKLNVQSKCARCATLLPPGQVAHLGVRDVPGPRVLICDACLPTTSQSD
jgi:hypothetical protein